MELSTEMTWAVHIGIVAVMAAVGWFVGGKFIPATTTTWNNEIGAVVGGIIGIGVAYFANTMMSTEKYSAY